jgi:phosphatidylethanolamine/phosphatidyl-N-methylethanolamine N-methyltransferase
MLPRSDPLPLPFAAPLGDQRRHGLKDIALWFRALRRDPRTMGAIFPSSRILARALAHSAVRGRPDSGIVEIGAGSGTVTDALVRVSDGRRPIRAIEVNGLLAARLQRRLPQVEVFAGLFEDVYAEAFAGMKGAVAVSSVPLFALSDQARAGYLAALGAAIDRGWIGRYVQYTYWPVLPWAEAKVLCGYRPRLIAMNCPPAWVWCQDHRVALAA